MHVCMYVLIRGLCVYVCVCLCIVCCACVYVN